MMVQVLGVKFDILRSIKYDLFFFFIIFLLDFSFSKDLIHISLMSFSFLFVKQCFNFYPLL